MIARTEVHAAAEAGSYDQALYVDPNATKVWLATDDARTREAHRAADGQSVRIAEPFRVGGTALRFPGDPLGAADETINCVVGDTVVDAPLIKMAMRSWYQGQVIDIEVAGETLTVTPNHPVLTREGWVSAHTLKPGDRVFRGDISRQFGKNDEKRRPTKISEIFDLAPVLRHTEGKYLPANFHGERRMTEIHVVAEDRLLGLEVVPTDAQEFIELMFSATDRSRLSFSSTDSCTVPLGATGRRLESFSASDVSVVCQCSVFCSSSTDGHQAIRLSLASEFDPRAEKHAVYCLAGNLETLSQRETTFAVDVTLDQIVNITKREFSGHVYNLTTTGGWYTGNSIITGNCRCSVAYDFDIVTTVDPATSDDLAQVAAIFDVPPGLIAAGGKWNPQAHPRGNDGKFIKKGAVSYLLSTKKPLIGDVAAAVNDLTPAAWGNLTKAQQDYITTSVNKLPEGSKLKKDLSAKLVPLIVEDSEATTPSVLKVVAPKKSLIPAHKGAAPGSPAKVTTTLIWSPGTKYDEGTVILENKLGDERITWNGKQYVHQVQNDDGSWTDQTTMTKKAAYEVLKNDTHWKVPSGAPTAAVSPTVTPVSTAPADTFKTGQSLSLVEGKKYLIDTTHSPGTVVGRSVNDQERLVATDVLSSLGDKPTYRRERLNAATGEWDVVQENVTGIGAVQILRGGQQSPSTEKNWLIPESTFNPMSSTPTPSPTYVADKAQWQKQWEKGLVTTEEFEQEFGEKPVELTVALTPTAAQTEHLSEQQNFAGLKKTSGQKGSNPGGFFTGPDGKKYYVKKAKSEKHAANEVAASALYNLAGIETPQVRKGTGAPEIGGGLQTGTELVPGAVANLKTQLENPAFKKELQRGFAVDAWLANWDVAGLAFDNVVTGADGKPHRIDVGGALLFRAMGAPKGSAFGAEVTELNTLRDAKKNWQSAAVFGDMTDQELWESAQRVTGITDAQIDQIVKDSGLDASVAKTLKARRDFIAKKYPPDKPSGGVNTAPLAEDILAAQLSWNVDPTGDNAAQFAEVIDQDVWNHLSAFDKTTLFNDVQGSPGLQDKLLGLNGGKNPLTVPAKKAAKKVAKKVAPPAPTPDKAALLGDLKMGYALSSTESVFLADNMTIGDWNDLTDSQKVTLALNVDTALDNGVPNANNAFAGINAFKAAEAKNAAATPKPLSYSSESIIDNWPGAVVNWADEGVTVGLSGDGKFKLVAGKPTTNWANWEVHVVDVGTGETAATYSGYLMGQGAIQDDYPGDWIVPPPVSKPSPAMAVPATTSVALPGVPIGPDDWGNIAANNDSGEYAAGAVVAKTTDGTLELVKSLSDNDVFHLKNSANGTTLGVYNASDLESGTNPGSWPRKSWVTAPTGTPASGGVATPKPLGTLSEKTIFAVGLTGGKDGDVLAIGTSPSGTKYRMTVKTTPTGKIIQMETESKTSPGSWSTVGTFDNFSQFNDEWQGSDIGWNPPTSEELGLGEEIETEDQWVDVLNVGPVGTPTTLAVSTKGDFQLVAHPDGSYTVEEQEAGSGSWIDLKTFTVEELDDEYTTITEVVSTYTGQAWLPATPGVATSPATPGASKLDDEAGWWETVHANTGENAVTAPTVVAVSSDQNFRAVIDFEVLLLQEKHPNTGAWATVNTIIPAELDDDDQIIDTVSALSANWSPMKMSVDSFNTAFPATPTPPPAPTPAPVSTPSPVELGDISAISFFIKTKMKIAFKAANTGYWSKPEKIWDVVKAIQAQFPHPNFPNESQLSPLQIIKSMDSLHTGKDPSPYETKMVKWAASAKGVAYTGSVNIGKPSSTSTGPKSAPPTPFTAEALWASLGSKNDGDLLAEVTTDIAGTEWQLKKGTSATGEPEVQLFYKSPAGSSFGQVGSAKTQDKLASMMSANKMKLKPGSVGAPTSPTPTSPGVPAAGKLDMGTGDISHLSETQQKSIYDAFKAQPSTYLSSPDTDIYSAIKTIADNNGISLLQALRVIDAVGAKKVSKPDEHLFEKKIVNWLKSPKGAAVASGKPIPMPDTPKYAVGVDPKNIMSFEQSNALSYGVIQDAKALTLTKASKAASPAGSWTAAQQSGLRTYTGGTYYSINHYYRGKIDTISPTHQKAAQNAQLAMRPSTEAVLLHRGVGWDGVGGAKSHADIEKMLGQTWQAGGFFSTSIGGKPAFGGPVMIEVEAPPGTPMAYVEAPPDTSATYKKITQHPGEREMILAAGLHFKIISVKKASGKTVVRMRVVPPPTEVTA